MLWSASVADCAGAVERHRVLAQSSGPEWREGGQQGCAETGDIATQARDVEKNTKASRSTEKALGRVAFGLVGSRIALTSARKGPKAGRSEMRQNQGEKQTIGTVWGEITHRRRFSRGESMGCPFFEPGHHHCEQPFLERMVLPGMACRCTALRRKAPENPGRLGSSRVTPASPSLETALVDWEGS